MAIWTNFWFLEGGRPDLIRTNRAKILWNPDFLSRQIILLVVRPDHHPDKLASYFLSLYT